jgi:hypothetical protein
MDSKRHIAIILAIVIGVNGCTHAINIDKAEFEEEISQSDEYWEREHQEKIYQGDYIFHMNEGKDISASCFIKRDSSFVVFEIYDAGANVEIDSMTVPFSDIHSIEKIEI